MCVVSLVVFIAWSTPLARLNRRQEHQAIMSPAKYEGHLNPPTVHISRTTEISTEGTVCVLVMLSMWH